ncbi:hypothetical protein [Phytoactinopolyspora endophytica]|uniref:hypothetical protein n=1 Tax=Phytoactinopolyspora endophytica TaxID=1642495 RepID=UPI00101DB5EE|nr:hypothetical protein [Phytoactinopolyspora endophytica]
MTTLKRFASLAGTAALTLSLTACGGDDNDYCGLIEDAEEEFSGASDAEADPDMLQDLSDSYREIADAAPSEIEGDWRTVADAMENYAEVDWSDMEALEELENDEEFTELMDSSQAAFSNIEANVQAECDIDFTDGTESGEVDPDDGAEPDDGTEPEQGADEGTDESGETETDS